MMPKLCETKPEICPLCGGQGTVSKPTHIDCDVHEWTDNASGGYVCRICNGLGYIRV